MQTEKILQNERVEKAKSKAAAAALAMQEQELRAKVMSKIVKPVKQTGNIELHLNRI